MSILTITPNLEKKTAKFKGTVAAGEHVSVSIENASEISTSGLRLRVIDYSGNTLAMFPEPSLEESMDGVGDWGGGGSVLTCELSLNTAPMHKAVCGMCEREFTVVLDNVAEKELHFLGQHTFLGWPEEKGSDIPYDFDEFPKLIDDWIRQIENLTLTARRYDEEGKVEITVWDGRGGTAPVVVTTYDGDTSKVEEFARQAASAANAAAGSASEAKTALAAADTKIAAAKSEAVSSANSHSDGELRKHKTEADSTFATKTALEETNTNLTKEVTRAKAAETAIAEKAQDALDKYTQTLSTAQAAGIKAEEATKAALDAVSKIIGGAPEAFDTLKEIADWIAEDETGTQALLTQINGLIDLVSNKADTTAVADLLNSKVDKIDGKGLSTNDYTNDEQKKLAGIEAGAQKNPDLSTYATKEDVAAVKALTSLTYAELKAIRNEGKLVPGAQYRITDYVATVNPKLDGSARSAGNPFDIIVTADSTNTLSEHARAAIHEGDTYFDSCNLSAWDVWYCLDNDTSRFEWAVPDGEEDPTLGIPGRGVIYRLIDERRNDVPYDFKGIVYGKDLDGTLQWCYTFDGGSGTDASVIGYDGVHNNTIGVYSNDANVAKLNFITIHGLDCFNIVIGPGCRNMTLNHADLSASFYDISIGADCAEITLDCNYNIKIGSKCHGIAVKPDARYIWIGDSCSYCFIGNLGYNITIGSNGYEIIVENGNSYVKVGDYCTTLNTGANNERITIGAFCDNVFLSSHMNDMDIGSACKYISFYKSFGENIVIGPFNSNIDITTTSTTSSSSYYRNIVVSPSCNSGSESLTINCEVGQTSLTTYKPRSSQEIMV